MLNRFRNFVYNYVQGGANWETKWWQIKKHYIRCKLK